MAGPETAFALLGDRLYRASASGSLELVTTVGLPLPNDVFALGPEAGLLSTRSSARVNQFTIGQVPVASTISQSQTETYQFTRSSDGTVWAYAFSNVARFEPATNTWSPLALPWGATQLRVRGLAMTSADEGYLWVTSPLSGGGAQLIHHVDGGFAFLNDAGITWLTGEAPGEVYATTGAGLWPVGPSGFGPMIPHAPAQGFGVLRGLASGDLYEFSSNFVSKRSAGAWQMVLDLDPLNGPGIVDFAVRQHEGVGCGPNFLFFSSDAGTTWRNVIDAPISPSELGMASALIARNDGSVYVFGSGMTWLFDGGAAVKVPALADTLLEPMGPADFLVSKFPGLFRFDGTQLGAPMSSTFDASTFYPVDLAAQSPSSAWAVGTDLTSSTGSGAIVYWDGGVWDHVAPPPGTATVVPLVAAAGGTTWVSVGDHVYLRELGQWTDLGSAGVTLASGAQQMLGLAALSSTEVIACGQKGISVWSADGGWFAETSFTCRTVVADSVAGTALAGDGTVLYERAGRGVWLQVSMPINESQVVPAVSSVGLRGGRAWAAGDEGTIFVRP